MDFASSKRMSLFELLVSFELFTYLILEETFQVSFFPTRPQLIVNKSGRFRVGEVLTKQLVNGYFCL